MKKLVLSVIALTFAIFTVKAQTQGTELINGPVITFEKTVHNFGNSIPKNSQDVECEFIFTNTGNEPLILSNVRANCGCTTPNWSREPVLPGKTGSVKAKYTTTSRPGSFKKQVTVSSNGTNGAINLTIEGVVVETAQSELIKNDEGAPKAN